MTENPCPWCGSTEMAFSSLEPWDKSSRFPYGGGTTGVTSCCGRKVRVTLKPVEYVVEKLR